MPDTAAVRLQLAASPRLRAGGGATALPARDALLLAWLAIEGPTPRSRLAPLLWPDSTPQAARNALRQRLFQLKKLAGIDLVAGQETLALADGVLHDLEASDDVLAGLDAEAGAELREWLARQRQRRRERLRHSLAELADMAERSQDWADALGHARELLALDPLSEEAHRRVMRLHYLAGDRAAALLAFDTCERVLKHEVGAAPSPETLALLRTIEVSATAAPASVPASVLRPPRLIGRDAEWVLLQRHWNEGAVVRVEGEGGMGKSRLLAEAAAAWTDVERRVLHVGARPGDAGLPYALLARCLRALLPWAGEAPAGVRGELARLLPELGEPAVGSDSPTRFVQAVEAIFEQARTRGLDGLLVDDLHLADSASAELLPGLCSLPGLRWALACRPAELPGEVAGALDALSAARQIATLRLAPLDAQGCAELLDSLGLPGFVGAEKAQLLHRHTGGNPMFLLEAVRTLGSAAVGAKLPALPLAGQVILRRIGQLSMPAVRLARCAAVAGQDFSAALASRVLQVPPLDLADAWAELEMAQVLRDGAFTHDLIQEAALASVPAAIARELHRHIALDMQAHGGEPVRVAAQWLAAGEGLPAVPHLRRAGHQALARFRYAEAAQMLAQAGSLSAAAGERAAAFDLFFDAADAAATFGEPQRLAELVNHLEALADDDARLARAALVRAVFELGGGRYDAARDAARRGLEPARAVGLAEIESELLYAIGVVHWEQREVAAAIAHVEPALALRRALPVSAQGPEHLSTLITVVQALGAMQAAAGRFAPARALALEAFRLAEEAQRPHDLIGSAAELCVRDAEAGQPGLALEWAERGMRAVDGRAVNVDEWTRLAMARTNALLQRGQWGEAQAQLDALQQREGPGQRYAADVACRRALLDHLCGRRDLARKGLLAARQSEALTRPQQLWIDVMLAAVGEAGDAAVLLERVAAVDDVGLRARLLLRLAPCLEPAGTLPVLGIASAGVREGAQGLWLALQGRSALLLASAGRHAEAAAAAREAWRAHDAGVAPALAFVEFAADLGRALAQDDALLAARVLGQGRQWLSDAARTLPPAWRGNALARHPFAAALAVAT